MLRGVSNTLTRADMQCGQRGVVLVQLTIFAGIVGAFADLRSRPRSNHR